MQVEFQRLTPISPAVQALPTCPVLSPLRLFLICSFIAERCEVSLAKGPLLYFPRHDLLSKRKAITVRRFLPGPIVLYFELATVCSMATLIISLYFSLDIASGIGVIVFVKRQGSQKRKATETATLYLK